MLKTFSLCVVCALSAGSWVNSPVESSEVEVVGPSVLLNARENGAVQILDLRASGRAVPGAQKQYQRNRALLFVLADETVAHRWLSSHDIKSAFIIPPRFIEYEKLNGVPQIEPRDAHLKVHDSWPIFDISEQFEFDKSRLPRSQRFDYAAFRARHWHDLPRDKPFIVACRVGHRSQLVVQELRENGYDARNLDGGLWQWECDGLEVTR